MDYEGIVRAVPEYERFMTVDELNESSRRLADKHPDLVELFQVGESTREEPIYALKIGEGKRKAILVGFPHPNEPIGGLAIEYLSSRLVEDECLREHLGFTWYFVKVADVDGARLNEGWFKEKYDNIRYMLNRYRPPARRQVDRSFPVEYKTLKWDKPMPETKVLMNMIDTVKPDFVFTLHNSSFGGAYFYISEPCPPLYPKLQGLVVSQGLPLHLGEPYPYFRKLADGMFHIPVEEEIYNFLEKYCDKDPATIRNSGAGIWDYAKRVSNAFTIICEVPYIYDERIADATPTTITKREAVLKSLEISEEVFSLVKERYEGLADHLDSESPFFDVLAYYMKYHEPTLESKRQWTETDKTLDIPATVSEVFEKTVIEKYHSLEAIGQFIRLLDESVKRKPSVQRRLQKAQSSLLEELKRINSEMEKETDFEVIPIQKLVRVQVGTALHVVDFISRRCQPTL